MLALPSTFVHIFFILFMLMFSYFCQSKNIANRLHWKAFPQTIILRICFLFPLFKDLFWRGIEESTCHHRAMFWTAESEFFRPSEHRSRPYSLKGLHSFCTMALKQGWWDRLCASYNINLFLHSYAVFYAGWERIHCGNYVELLIGYKWFAHAPRVLNML